MFAEAIAAILAHHCTTDIVRGIEAGASAQLLSGALQEAGFLELLAPEEHGGADAGWREFFEVVSLCGAWAVPLPLAQTIAARRFTIEPERLPAGFISFAPTLIRGSGGTFLAFNVPSGRTSSHVIGVIDEVLVLLAVSDASSSSSGRGAGGIQAKGIQGSLDASFCWPAHAVQVLRGGIAAAELAPIAALLHAGLLTGAMKRCFDLTMAYANERIQFGKPIGKFQAIQHQLSVMAEHVAAGRMAVEAAFATDAIRPALMACAIAKARSSEAAQHVAAISHAVHGAIGVTAEYELQLFTRRLHGWRMAHGSEVCWHRVLGQHFLDSRQPLVVDFVRTVWETASA
jgi:acyl-CoA dehydrogenase